MKNQHTPGPWYVTDIAIIGNDGGTWVAEHPAVKWQTLKSVTKSGDAIVAESIKQANANANLIAAAPDLLSSLIALEKASREELDTSATHEGLKNCKILVEARIAIEKAGGEWK